MQADLGLISDCVWLKDTIVMAWLGFNIAFVYDPFVALNKTGFLHLDIFVISPWKHMLLVLTRSHSSFFFLQENGCWGYSLEVPQWGASNEYPQHMFLAGLGGSVGWLETRRLQVRSTPRSATFLRGDWSWNIFYGHSLPSADSRRAVVSFWRKNVHNTG